MNTTHLIASANTAGGFAIGITLTGKTYSVIRMDRASRYITISVHTTEADARKRANAEYRADVATAA